MFSGIADSGRSTPEQDFGGSFEGQSTFASVLAAAQGAFNSLLGRTAEEARPGTPDIGVASVLNADNRFVITQQPLVPTGSSPPPSSGSSSERSEETDSEAEGDDAQLIAARTPAATSLPTKEAVLPQEPPKQAPPQFEKEVITVRLPKKSCFAQINWKRIFDIAVIAMGIIGILALVGVSHGGLFASLGHGLTMTGAISFISIASYYLAVRLCSI